MTVTALPRTDDSLTAAADQMYFLIERLHATSVTAGAAAWARVTVNIHAASTAEVDAIAGLWGVKAGWDATGSHYTATVKDGPAVLCMACYIRQDREDRPAPGITYNADGLIVSGAAA